ncbi:MAG TPA: ABC transporter permease [Polyangiaceae bacterium]|nr:ABC transporter permease [Polyangiaceae bacterium]
MTSLENAALLNASVDRVRSVATYAQQVHAVAAVEARKLLRDPTELFTRSVQPALWLLVFGQVFTRTRAIPTGALSYTAFMAPGILAQSVLFTAIFYGIAVIWERDLGTLHKLLVSPAWRSALVVGKGVSSGIRGLAQAAIVYVIAALLGAKPRFDPVSLLGVAICVVLASAMFSTFSLIIACLVKTRERFMGIGQVLTMPLFFASNAIYPLQMMPPWLRVIARGNPLSYVVDALRLFMVGGGAIGLRVDFAVMLGVLCGLIAVAAWLYPTLVR